MRAYAAAGILVLASFIPMVLIDGVQSTIRFAGQLLLSLGLFAVPAVAIAGTFAVIRLVRTHRLERRELRPAVWLSPEEFAGWHGTMDVQGGDSK